MNITEPHELGDAVYPQYLTVGHQKIKTGVEIIKGNIYTVDDDGLIINPTATSGIADLSKGIHQAMVSVLASDDSTSTAQFIEVRSRVLLKGTVGLVKGQIVQLAASDVTVTADKCQNTAVSSVKGYLGRIFEIYTKDGNDEKTVTVDNDYVIIDMGVA